MSSVQFLGTAVERPSEVGWRSEYAWSDLELPDWNDFVGARDRFFAGLDRMHAEHLARAQGDEPSHADPGIGSR